MIQLFLFILQLSSLYSAELPELSTKQCEQLLSNGPAIILFYMDDDSLSLHVQDAVSQVLPNITSLGVPVGQFNCMDAPHVCKKAQIEDIPDIKFIKFGLSIVFTSFSNLLSSTSFLADKICVRTVVSGLVSIS